MVAEMVCGGNSVLSIVSVSPPSEAQLSKSYIGSQNYTPSGGWTMPQMDITMSEAQIPPHTYDLEGGISFSTSAKLHTNVSHEGGTSSEISFYITSSSIQNFNAALEELMLQLQALKMETSNSD